MLALVQHLIRGGRYGRARLTQLARLLARFESQPSPRFAPHRVRAMAEEITRLKLELGAALAGVTSCSGCAKACVAPSGYFPGGRCCGTSALEVFTPGEVRAIKLAGGAAPTAPADDGAEEAGCLFRGSTGCSLDTASRPARCLVYVCLELQQELEAEPHFGEVQSLRKRLQDTLAEFERASC